MYDQSTYTYVVPFQFYSNLCKTEITPFTNYCVSWFFRVAYKLEKSELLNSMNGEGLL